MEFTAEWKSLWPISSTFSAPLLIPNKDPKTPLGPLIFAPKPDSTTTLLQSPSFSPHLPPRYSQLLLSRFFQCNYVPSSAASISSLIGPHLPNLSSEFHGFNSLQLLQIPNKNLIAVFFPTGENSDHVGFSLLSAKDGILGVHSQRENFFHVVEEGNMNRQRITSLLVNAVDDFCCDEIGDKVSTVVGFLMVCTKYSVRWYRVGITNIYKQSEYSVCLDYVGCANAKMLRGNAVVSSCWSPHFREECLVLLESGDLLMFDVNYFSREKGNAMFLVNGGNRFVDKTMQVSLSDKLGLVGESSYGGRQWLRCEFSWHPRIFIVCHCNEVLLVDLRFAGECNVCCLLKLEMLSKGKYDVFCSLSRAGSDGFYFTVATRYLLLLCDVRKPLMPVLRWAHCVRNPGYMTVCKLSELRANAEDTKYHLASESGYCVILGSFWDNNFSLFCYGPDDDGGGPVHSEIFKFCNSYYAWGLPSEISLSGSECKCGSCLVREEFWKASLPVWTDWRQKKDIILGFGILEPSISMQLSSFGGFGGFTLIRLTSSGKLEAQSYLAAWGSDKFLEAGHKRKNICLEENLLYECDYSEYDGEKKFQHLKLEFLNAYLRNKLEKCIVKRLETMRECDENVQKKYVVNSKCDHFHKEICLRLQAFGLPKEGPSFTFSAVLEDISWPISIYEIALRSIFAALPTNLLQLAFSTYSDFGEDHEEPLEFLDIPDERKFLPFSFRMPSYRGNKWSTKIRPPDGLVGPILPPHFLSSLHELCVDDLKDEKKLYLEDLEEFSAHSRFKLQCDKVVDVVQEHNSGRTQDDHYVSLAEDTEDMSYKTQRLYFSCHKPSAFLEPHNEDYIYSTHVFGRSQGLSSDLSAGMLGKTLFDVGCPIQLNFNDSTIDFGPNELEIFRNLKKQDLEFQKCFKPYQEYIVRDNGLK